MKKITFFLMALLLAIPAMAHNLAANSKIYFDKPSDWRAAQFMLGKSGWSEGYLMSKIANTNLWVINTIQWDGYTKWGIHDDPNKWGGSGDDGGIDGRYNWTSKKITLQSTAIKSFTLVTQSGNVTTNPNSYTQLNKDHTITIDGEAGDVTISSYYLSAYDTAKATSGSATSGSATCQVVFTANVTCTAREVEGYQFAGWYDGATLIDAHTTYTYTAENAAKTIIAKYEKISAETPVLSNFTASSIDVEVGETVTFSCDVENPADGVDVVYTVDGEAIEGNTWTPDAVGTGTYEVEATYEGAISQYLSINVYQEPSYLNDEVIVFFDNTDTQWATVNAYVWITGGESNSWPGEACTYLGNNKWMWKGTGIWETTQPENIIFNNGSDQTDDLKYVNGGMYTSVALQETVTPTPYTEGITCEQCYFLVLNDEWAAAAGNYYAKFINKNTGDYTWVMGAPSEGVIVFYLSQYNVRSVAEMPTYTHVIFFKAAVDEADINDAAFEAATLKTEAVAMDATNSIYAVEGGEISTGIESVVVADGIRYAYGVVEAKGAIEVYNINGTVVARGNDNVDLAGLGRGVYIIRNGNQVRKVVR